MHCFVHVHACVFICMYICMQVPVHIWGGAPDIDIGCFPQLLSIFFKTVSLTEVDLSNLVWLSGQ